MSNSRYSPAALERRKKRAAETYRERWRTDENFREGQRIRNRRHYANHRERIGFSKQLANARLIATDQLRALTKALKSGEITINEFNRRFRETFVRDDA